MNAQSDNSVSDDNDNNDNKDNEVNGKGDKKESGIFNETFLRQIELFMVKFKRLFLRLIKMRISRAIAIRA